VGRNDCDANLTVAGGLVLAFRIMDDGYCVYLASVDALKGIPPPEHQKVVKDDDMPAEPPPPRAILNPSGRPSVRPTSLAPEEPSDDTKRKPPLLNLRVLLGRALGEVKPGRNTARITHQGWCPGLITLSMSDCICAPVVEIRHDS